jgi:hypothetical protein
MGSFVEFQGDEIKLHGSLCEAPTEKQAARAFPQSIAHRLSRLQRQASSFNGKS